VFLLDEEGVANRLARLETLSREKLRWDESSGMRQLYMQDAETLDRWQILRQMYQADMQGIAA
jgi:hypothetical protein